MKYIKGVVFVFSVWKAINPPDQYDTRLKIKQAMDLSKLLYP